MINETAAKIIELATTRLAELEEERLAVQNQLKVIQEEMTQLWKFIHGRPEKKSKAWRSPAIRPGTKREKIISAISEWSTVGEAAKKCNLTDKEVRGVVNAADLRLYIEIRSNSSKGLLEYKFNLQGMQDLP